MINNTDALYDKYFDNYNLGFVISRSEEPEKPIAFALYRDYRDVLAMRRYMQTEQNVPDPDNPGEYKKIYQVVTGSERVFPTSASWSARLNAFLNAKSGWINTDFSEEARWGLGADAWQTFIMSHVTR